MTAWPDDDVILFDGVCVFCSRRVRFVAGRDKAKRFRFTTIQSPYGARLAQALGIDPNEPDTNAVIHGVAVPRPLRDAVYNVVAKNRYRIFGKYDACMVPDADLRVRIIE